MNAEKSWRVPTSHSLESLSNIFCANSYALFAGYNSSSVTVLISLGKVNWEINTEKIDEV